MTFEPVRQVLPGWLVFSPFVTICNIGVATLSHLIISGREPQGIIRLSKNAQQPDILPPSGCGMQAKYSVYVRRVAPSPSGRSERIRRLPASALGVREDVKRRPDCHPEVLRRTPRPLRATCDDCKTIVL
jgi:hypothetical protein